MSTLHDELGQDDWDGQDWAEELTHPRSHRTAETARDVAADSIELDGDGYVFDWKFISDRKRRDHDYTCEQCRVRLHDNLRLLHVHHIDRDKQDNCNQNLRVLCAICHANCEGHAHLSEKISSSDRLFIEMRRKLQHGLPQINRKQKIKPLFVLASNPAKTEPTNAPLAVASQVQITERRNFILYEYSVIARFWKGQYRAKGVSFRDNSKVEAVGESLQDIVQKIGAKIQALIDKRKNEERALLPLRHKEYVEDLGRVYRGVRSRTSVTRRTDKCYACHTLVDNSVDLECVACGWIICSHCAACGCGYSHK